MVFLSDAPVAERYSSRDQLRSNAAQGYRAQVQSQQNDLISDLASRNFKVTGSVSTVLNAVFVTAPRERIEELRTLPGVVGVRPVRRGQKHLNRAVQLMNAPAAWTSLGGPQNGGKGMKIAVLDTGIDQTHPAFQDASLPVPEGFPKCNVPSDCLNFTNSKVIVARSYVSLIANEDPDHLDPATSVPDDYSARDRDGHGTAVASAAAANTTTGTVTFTGMAPKAYLGSYKIYGSPGVNDFPLETVWAEAIEDALNDGMDVAVLSSGFPAVNGPLDQGAACGLSGTAPCDPLATAFENVAKAGLVIVVSSGNSGQNGTQYPNFGSVSSPAYTPSVLAVGATTTSHVLTPVVSVTALGAPVNLQRMTAQVGDSVSNLAYGAANSQTAALVDVGNVGSDGLACGVLPSGSLNSAFALIQLGGVCQPAYKASNAQTAGAVGIIFYAADSSAPVPVVGVDEFYGPVVAISNSDGLALKRFIDANPAETVTIDLAGEEQDLSAYNRLFQFNPPLAENQLASYSSPGPALGSYAIKPDLVATGGLDNSLFLRPEFKDGNMPIAPGMYLAAQNFDPLGEMYSPSRYAAADGTSFSAPLVAGAAAMVKQNHPAYTAAQIRSALINTAAQDVTVDDFGVPADVRSLGGGRLDAAAAVNATVTAEPATLSFGRLKSGSPLPRPITVTIVNHGASPVTLVAAVVVSKAATGIAVSIDKQSLTLAAGGSATLTVSLTGSVPAAGSYSGGVTLKGPGVSMRLPYLFLVGSGTAFNVPYILGYADGIVGQDMGEWAVQVTDFYGLPVSNANVRFSVAPRGSVTFQSVPGGPPCTPASSTINISCPTDEFGYAWVDIVLGATPGTPTITVTAAGLGSTFSVTARQQPMIAEGGVLPAANVDKGAPISPGSYVSIYGTGLSDYTEAETTAMLPISLDNVTVSFDVPSAHLSVPASLLYVSPTQVNVQVPWELQGQTSAQVKITLNEYEFGNVVTVPLADAGPGFFHAVADARDLNFQTISTGNPAQRGQAIQLYVNGLGPLDNQPATGYPASGKTLATTRQTPVVTIGGQPATVLFSGLAPGFPGLYQVNVIVPAGIGTGSQPVALSIGGQSARAATIPVK